MSRRKIVLATLLIIAKISVGSFAYAATKANLPTFPNCKNPQGAIKVTYSSGTHGIPGNPAVFVGSDSVYTLTNETVMQCYCPASGDAGIQTNWWKVSELSIIDIEELTALGWIYVPNGANWGLDAEPYLAFNISYDCKDDNSNDDDDEDSDDDDDNDDDEKDLRIGGVLGAATGIGGQILGLATTGNLQAIALTAVTGAAALVTAYYISKKKK